MRRRPVELGQLRIAITDPGFQSSQHLTTLRQRVSLAAAGQVLQTGQPFELRSVLRQLGPDPLQLQALPLELADGFQPGARKIAVQGQGAADQTGIALIEQGAQARFYADPVGDLELLGQALPDRIDLLLKPCQLQAQRLPALVSLVEGGAGFTQFGGSRRKLPFGVGKPAQFDVTFGALLIKCPSDAVDFGSQTFQTCLDCFGRRLIFGNSGCRQETGRHEAGENAD